jgi:ribosomal protein L40E
MARTFPGVANSSGQADEFVDDPVIDIRRRRDQLHARVAELQWDLGGLVYEMASRNRIRVDVLVKQAVELQNADAELSEIERILKTEQTGTAGICVSCNAPHSSGAVFCWQCGHQIVRQVETSSIFTGNPE